MEAWVEHQAPQEAVEAARVEQQVEELRPIRPEMQVRQEVALVNQEALVELP